MSTTKQPSTSGKKTNSSNTKAQKEDKSLSTERWVEPDSKLSKDKEASKTHDAKPKPHMVPAVDEEQWAKQIVNEQEQNAIVNQDDNVTSSASEDSTDTKNLNEDDFPEADQPAERPFKKVPTMDA